MEGHVAILQSKLVDELLETAVRTAVEQAHCALDSHPHHVLHLGHWVHQVAEGLDQLATRIVRCLTLLATAFAAVGLGVGVLLWVVMGLAVGAVRLGLGREASTQTHPATCVVGTRAHVLHLVGDGLPRQACHIQSVRVRERAWGIGGEHANLLLQLHVLLVVKAPALLAPCEMHCVLDFALVA